MVKKFDDILTILTQSTSVLDRQTERWRNRIAIAYTALAWCH